MKVFLSSTYIDLIEHRKAAHDALERLGQEVGRMEIFGARAEEATTVALDQLEKSDLIIGIYAYRYGFIPEGSEISITEQEYVHAKSKGKPVLCFVVDEEHPWSPKMMEKDAAKIKKLEDFKAKVLKEKVVDFFTTPADLAMKIVTSVHNYLEENKPSQKHPSPNSKSSSLKAESNFILRITSGKELFSIMAGVHFSDLDYDEPASKEELELLSGFIQNLQDWADIGDEIEYGGRVEIGYNLTQEIQSLNEKGFAIFGKRENKKLKINGIEDYWTIAIVRILRNTNPAIVTIDLSQISKPQKS